MSANTSTLLIYVAVILVIEAVVFWHLERILDHVDKLSGKQAKNVGLALVLAVMVLTILYGFRDLHEAIVHRFDVQPTTNRSLDASERLAEQDTK